MAAAARMAAGVAAARVAAAAVATITAAIAAAATMAGDGLRVATDQGDTDNREEDRDREQQRTIHASILQVGKL